MTVSDLMQKEVTTLRLDDNLDIADDIMTLGRVRHLPVLNAAGSLVGLVTQRDLLKASVASVLKLGRSAEKDWLSSISVENVMAKEISTIRPSASISDAVDQMITLKIGCLPVVEGGKLVGLVTETDCLNHLRSLLNSAGKMDSCC